MRHYDSIHGYSEPDGKICIMTKNLPKKEINTGQRISIARVVEAKAVITICTMMASPVRPGQ